MTKEYLKFYLGANVLLVGDEVCTLTIMSIRFWDRNDKIVLRKFSSLTEDELKQLDKPEQETDSNDEDMTHIVSVSHMIKSLTELCVDVFGLIDRNLAIDYDTMRK